jgi:hypothetical protein
MMRTLVMALVLAGGLATPLAANPLTDQVTGALVAQGYQIVQVDRTWLGRVRIVAETPDLRREIVINPNTGEVLRDYSVLLVATSDALRPSENLFDDDNDPARATAATRLEQEGPPPDVSLSATEALTDSVVVPVEPQGD